MSKCFSKKKKKKKNYISHISICQNAFQKNIHQPHFYDVCLNASQKKIYISHISMMYVYMVFKKINFTHISITILTLSPKDSRYLCKHSSKNII